MTSKAEIQTKLLLIKGDSIFAFTVRNGAVMDLAGTIQMIKDQAADKRSRPGVIKAIGEKLLKMIENV